MSNFGLQTSAIPNKVKSSFQTQRFSFRTQVADSVPNLLSIPPGVW